MRTFITFPVKNQNEFTLKLISWANHFKTACCLNSNESGENSLDKYYSYYCIAAIDKVDEIIIPAGRSYPRQNAFALLKEFYNNKKDWLFGFFSYDLKNKIEELISENHDGINMPLLHFFQPKYVFLIKNNTAMLGYLDNLTSEDEAKMIFRQIIESTPGRQNPPVDVHINNRISKEQLKFN